MKILPRLAGLVGVGVFIYLISKIGLRSVIDNLLNANLKVIFLSVLLIFPISFLQILRWFIISDDKNIAHIYLYVIFYFKSLFYGFITPGKAGTFIRIKYLKDSFDYSTKKATHSVVLDRFSDVISIAILFLFGNLLSGKTFVEKISVLALLSLFLVVFFNNYHVLNKIFPKKLNIYITSSFKGNKEKALRLVFSFALGLFSWLLIYIQAWLVSIGLEAKVNLTSFLYVAPFSTLVGLIPITIGGFGTRDGVYVAMMKSFGVSSALALSMSLAGYAVNALIPAIIGLILVIVGMFNKNKLLST